MIIGRRCPRGSWRGRRHPARGTFQTLTSAVAGERRKLTRSASHPPLPSQSPKSLRLDHQVQWACTRDHWIATLHGVVNRQVLAVAAILKYGLCFLPKRRYLGKRRDLFVGVPAPLGYVPGVARGESSFGFLVQ